jgi:glycosyltransferase involved in cell wall biosynthesis
MNRAPSVTVIIPTVCRPLLLQRAIISAARQTQPPEEILVVVDGADEETLEMLRVNPASSVRVISVPKKLGAAEVRNIGVRAARSDWIAFLDDDDEWLPEKLERQHRVALASTLKYPIVFSRVIVRTPSGDFTMPRRAPRRGEAICDYLFSRRTILPGEVLLQTSNLFAPRELLAEVPLRTEQRKWNDTDWLLRTQQIAGAGLEFIPEVLSIWYCEDSRRGTISGSLDWEYLFRWAVSNRALFSRQSYSGVMLVRIAREAAREGAKRFARPILTEAIVHGSPDLIQIIWFLLGALPSSFLSEGVYAKTRKFLRRIGDLLVAQRGKAEVLRVSQRLFP